MTAFTPEQERRIQELMTARLRPTRHENSDHLNYALLPMKLKSNAGAEVLNGYAATTSDTSTPAGGAYTQIVAITVTGDGATPMLITTHCYGAYNNTTANTYLAFSIYEGGAGVAYSRTWAAVVSTAYQPGDVSYRAPAFTGSKTFAFMVGASGGVGVAQASGTPVFIRAVWSPQDAA